MATSAAPILAVVHDDREDRSLLVWDLRARFGGQYEIEAHGGASVALRALCGTRLND